MELQIGKWYYYNDWLLCYTGKRDGILIAYGFSPYTGWEEDVNCGSIPELWKEATEQEVKDALVKEAEKRGLFNNSILGADGFTVSTYSTDMNLARYVNGRLENELYCTLFENGKWATINTNTSKQEPKFNVGDKIVHCGDYEDVGCVQSIRYEEDGSIEYEILWERDDVISDHYEDELLSYSPKEYNKVTTMDNNLDELDKAFEMEQRLDSKSEPTQALSSSRTSTTNYDNAFPRKKPRKYVNQDPELNVLVRKRM